MKRAIFLILIFVSALSYSAENALSFRNINNSYVQCFTSTSLNLIATNSSGITYEAYVLRYSTGNTDEFRTIFDRENGTGGIQFAFVANTLGAEVWRSGGVTQYRTIASPGNGEISANVWHHVAFCLTATSGTFFVDGKKRGSTRGGTAGLPTTASTSAKISGSPYATEYMDGIIDEVRISSVVRYTVDFTTSASAFVSDSFTHGLWHLDEGSGIATVDSSAKGNNGELVNSPTWVAGYPFSEATTAVIIKKLTPKIIWID